MIKLHIDDDKRLWVVDRYGKQTRDTGDYLLFFGENRFEEIEITCVPNIHGNTVRYCSTSLVIRSDEERVYPVSFTPENGILKSDTILMDAGMTSRAGEIFAYVKFEWEDDCFGRTGEVKLFIRSGVCGCQDLPGTLRVAAGDEPQEYSSPAGYGRVEVAAVDAGELTVTPDDSRQVYSPGQGKYYSKVTVERPDLRLQDADVTPAAYAQTVRADEEHFALRSVRVQPISSSLDLQIKRVTPSLSFQTVTPDGEYVGLSEVRVDPVSAAVDANIFPENIRKDVSILGVTGTMENIEVTVDDSDEEVPAARFYDYDGTLLGSYTASELEGMSAPPLPPAHQGLTFLRYNRSLASMKHYLCDLNVSADAGAMYDTPGGHTVLGLSVGTARGSSSLSVTLGMCFYNAHIRIDWGDSQTEDFISNDQQQLSHTYARGGHYSVRIECLTGQFALGNNPLNGRITSDRFLIEYAYVGNNCTLSRYTFRCCDMLRSVVLTPAIAALTNYLFDECRSLRYAVIPDTVAEIPAYCFNACTSLLGAALPDTVNVIRSYAFFGCSSLRTAFLPEDLETLENAAFRECIKLKSVYPGEQLESIDNYVFCNCVALTSVKLPSSVQRISHYSFNTCSSLRRIDLPDSVTEIGDRAFADDRRLTFESLPPRLSSVGIEAFKYTTVKIPALPAALQSAGLGAFNSCLGMESLTVDGTLTTLGASLFGSCEVLSSVTVRAAEIPDSCFANCKTLSDVELTPSVTRISQWAFDGCKAMTGLVIPPSVTYIGDAVFSGASQLRIVDLSGFTVPPTVTASTFNGLSEYARFVLRDEAARTLFLADPVWSQQASRLVIADS